MQKSEIEEIEEIRQQLLEPTKDLIARLEKCQLNDQQTYALKSLKRTIRNYEERLKRGEK